MADTKYYTLLNSLADWLYESCRSFKVRPWCHLNFSKPFTFSNLIGFFKREQLNNDFKVNYNSTDINAKKPVSFIQSEIQFIAQVEKAYIVRHKSRLQYYRDDFSQKQYHLKKSIDDTYCNVQRKVSAADKPMKLA